MYEIDTTDLILSIILTWGVGLLPPVLIRYAILKRPVANWLAIAICIFFWFCNIILFTALGSKSKTHAGLLMVAGVSFWILQRKNKTSSALPIQVQTESSPNATFPAGPAPTGDHGSSVHERLLSKKHIAREWLYLLGGIAFGFVVAPFVVYAFFSLMHRIHDASIPITLAEFYSRVFSSFPDDRSSLVVILGPYLLFQLFRSLLWAWKTGRTT